MSEIITRRYYRAAKHRTWHIAGEDGLPVCGVQTKPGGTHKTDLTLVDRGWACRKCHHRVSAKPFVPRPPISEAPPSSVFLTQPRKRSADLATTGQQCYLLRYGHATAMQAAGMTVSEASAIIDAAGA
ncbi:hypothetical protein CCAX7_55050 [Capsulimonas corticalis]|uniref:Uncharacterized protein n=1 Tax=Capsulimonas corticalis TaxID=2219043 RepID=A0A402D5L6_9BACT|nr:hypothetical protein [Capsulimonas corticalis]BDI33454.1 hypothetical protein CCAX7_55050 [Capsulimonas corticalis]